MSQTILCDDCGFSTFNQKQFNAHKLANCKNVTYKGDKYPCEKCEYEATKKSSLLTHVKSQHEGVKYLCDQCN